MAFTFRLKGFPPPEKRDTVHFHFAKNMTYDVRVMVFSGLVILGMLFQIITLTPWPGIPFLMIGVGLMLVKGYDSRARLKHYQPDAEWTDVDMERINQIEVIRKRNLEWDKDALDITNATGFGMFVLVLLVTAGVTFFAFGVTRRVQTALIIPINAMIVLIPFWMTGLRFVLKQPNLAVKIRVLKQLEEQFQHLKQDNETFVPALMLAKDETGKALPTDVRFTIRFDNIPDGFYGLQAQININLVQGSSYPYFYCVIAAKPGFGLNRFMDRVKQSQQVICEYQEDAQAEVLVIRQFTTKNSGYHTNKKACWEIMWTAVDAARTIIQEAQ